MEAKIDDLKAIETLDDMKKVLLFVVDNHQDCNVSFNVRVN